MSWIQGIQDEWNTKSLEDVDVNEFFELDQPEEGEEVVGVAPDEAQKIFLLLRQKKNELQRVADEHKQLHRDSVGDHSDLDCAEFYRQAHQLENEASVLKSIFWRTLESEYDLWDSSLGIRTDFQVVKLPQNEEGDVPSDIMALNGHRIATLLARAITGHR